MEKNTQKITQSFSKQMIKTVNRWQKDKSIQLLPNKHSFLKCYDGKSLK